MARQSSHEPRTFSAGVLASCGLIAARLQISLSELLSKAERFGLGTTAVTNVFATQHGHCVGLMTTAGFEGHLHSVQGAYLGRRLDDYAVEPCKPRLGGRINEPDRSTL